MANLQLNPGNYQLIFELAHKYLDKNANVCLFVASGQTMIDRFAYMISNSVSKFYNQKQKAPFSFLLLTGNDSYFIPPVDYDPDQVVDLVIELKEKGCIVQFVTTIQLHSADYSII